MNEDSKAVCLAVLAKAPVPGLAKTRLIPALGAVGAARLQRRFTQRTLRTALRSGLGPVALWCAPQVQHRFFQALRRSGVPLALHAQPEGDLGLRMLTALQAGCMHGPTLLMGTDCPALSAAHLKTAAQALQEGADVVCQPAEDGGYVLIGMRQPQPLLFTDMPWSTAEVMPQTRARAQAAGLRLHELPPLWDVDNPEDLPRWHTLFESET
ncbi:TIGR04282 family arsenosugar biosynthesis glycosyltransferase [Ideonella paludis]|uniref:TIGR04282 family arsenosugar biosynthesis glycosyltransferase n=1 Tax=Ideonella paludis TaxID=1233411 RepID=A0ABS5DTD4_9BURK|nr:TIGR04282 family arsenosugar biosynthesis glycosyltransferase [Ideonella paludis]MBQ0934403.1 TIGR04282 family arsenosugar biosynthesis glycosyltransferase [Ideonella paludis]